MDTTTADAEQDQKHAEAIAENARRDEIADMRDWLADCAWADMTPEDFDDLNDAEVEAGIKQHYAGGVAQFLADTHR